MSNPKATIHRRDFLGSLVVSSAALGLAGLTPFRLDAAQEKSAPAADTSQLEQWLGKIHGKHRQVFDSPQHVNGLPFIWTRVFYMTNEAVGVDKSDITGVLILRHNSIPFGMSEELWKKYNFGEMFDVKDMGGKKRANMNAFWQPKPGAFQMPGIGVLSGVGINELLADGAQIGICDAAITVFSGAAAAKMKKDPAEVKKEWEAGVLPGIQIVPSGVMAVNRAQEHGCTYCFAG